MRFALLDARVFSRVFFGVIGIRVWRADVCGECLLGLVNDAIHGAEPAERLSQHAQIRCVQRATFLLTDHVPHFLKRLGRQHLDIDAELAGQ